MHYCILITVLFDHCIILYCIILYCIILYCSYCTVHTVLYLLAFPNTNNTVSYCTAPGVKLREIFFNVFLPFPLQFCNAVDVHFVDVHFVNSPSLFQQPYFSSLYFIFALDCLPNSSSIWTNLRPTLPPHHRRLPARSRTTPPMASTSSASAGPTPHRRRASPPPPCLRASPTVCRPSSRHALPVHPTTFLIRHTLPTAFTQPPPIPLLRMSKCNSTMPNSTHRLLV